MEGDVSAGTFSLSTNISSTISGTNTSVHFLKAKSNGYLLSIRGHNLNMKYCQKFKVIQYPTNCNKILSRGILRGRSKNTSETLTYHSNRTLKLPVVS